MFPLYTEPFRIVWPTNFHDYIIHLYYSLYFYPFKETELFLEATTLLFFTINHILHKSKSQICTGWLLLLLCSSDLFGNGYSRKTSDKFRLLAILQWFQWLAFVLRTSFWKWVNANTLQISPQNINRSNIAQIVLWGKNYPDTKTT